MHRGLPSSSSSVRTGAQASWESTTPQSKAKATPVPEIWRPGVPPEVKPAASRTLAHASASLGADRTSDSASIHRSTSVRTDDRLQRDPDTRSLRERDSSHAIREQDTSQSRTSGLSRDSLSPSKAPPPSSVRRSASYRLAETPQIWKPGPVSRASSSSIPQPSDTQASRSNLARSVSSSANVQTRTPSSAGSYTLSIAKDGAANTRNQASSVQKALPASKPSASAHTTENSAPVPQSMATTLARRLNDLDTPAPRAAPSVRQAPDQPPVVRADHPPPPTTGTLDAVAAQSPPTESPHREPLSRSHPSRSRSRSRSAPRVSRGRADTGPSARLSASTHDERETAHSVGEDEKDNGRDNLCVEEPVKQASRKSSRVSFAVAAAEAEEDKIAREKAEAEEKAEEARQQEEERRRQEEEARHREEKRRKKKEMKRKEDEARRQTEEVRLREAEIARREEELLRREELSLRREAEVVQAQLNREEERSRRKTEELRRLEEGMRMWQRAIQKTEEDLHRREEEYRRFQAERPKEEPLKVHDVLEEVWNLRQQECRRPQWTGGLVFDD